ncbi:bifunctional 4-hydroxy-2-oxoglutarate aldolase/2-dehydro-3-deoxy-phosphogluconate aldolase [Herbiconiux sp. KACC 21604]|uniref:bifunctional 4-hydroxy-2-oxoglutarate aldolase/2-dehydro-3-deoxy-phosphogluconate aldolase n=1 Tax=unclassified Herbiconiux TaxID=2618217 RepID=UPI0014909D21|nr:bifunctional 4-hydroxy-2-oxoglutarate aldolase/2-dehydro-3-deoxy-phosphogluconate aldolase [Herbiconiux sp. SALV-R1]QJU55293.1 bifunctional 4-hydroxy-2-oxoglutarate aldolase/2-dehydro-3-deoxy-phosphogluconate aldolase [Herbiconiux sp. SALV-R1]WPO86460.1 bifunctional 4-hydroxy-2-oxoglutarate aldolase/2-dehydro-3-deoxy-phosphogluconate aldolase [Herbiconiux sp. KACC 21604]
MITRGVFDLEQLEAARIVAILRSDSASHLAACAETLIDSGISALEFALTTPGSVEAIRQMSSSIPEGVYLGAGTVITTELASAAAESGASFFVTPAVVLDVLSAAVERRIPVLCGAATATEALTAHRAGALAVKVFPAGVGSPQLIRALREPLPFIPLVPTGGVDERNAGECIRAGATAVGVGRSLLGDATEGGSLRALRERALRLQEAVRVG